jgi:hypothetical protein
MSATCRLYSAWWKHDWWIVNYLKTIGPDLPSGRYLEELGKPRKASVSIAGVRPSFEPSTSNCKLWTRSPYQLTSTYSDSDSDFLFFWPTCFLEQLLMVTVRCRIILIFWALPSIMQQWFVKDTRHLNMFSTKSATLILYNIIKIVKWRSH